MDRTIDLNDVNALAAQIDSDIRALPSRSTANVRAVRRRYSRELNRADAVFVLDLARELLKKYGLRWIAYELIRYHKAAFRKVGEAELQEFGQGMNSWDSVDTFARILSGPAWLKGQVSEDVIHRWARSDDLWWRRAALVSTVALNMRSQGGRGDLTRTFAVCRMLVSDREDMIEKAMSWALRELIVHDADAVRGFLAEHDSELAARVKREVRNKLTTGLKNPRSNQPV